MPMERAEPLWRPCWEAAAFPPSLSLSACSVARSPQAVRVCDISAQQHRGGTGGMLALASDRLDRLEAAVARQQSDIEELRRSHLLLRAELTEARVVGAPQETSMFNASKVKRAATSEEVQTEERFKSSFSDSPKASKSSSSVMASLAQQIVLVWDIASLIVRAAGWQSISSWGACAWSFRRPIGNLAFALPFWFPYRIYAIGGQTSSSMVSASAECFSHDGNSLGSWVPLPDMRVARKNSVAVVTSGVVCVSGGQDALGDPLASVELFVSGGTVSEAAARWLDGPPLREPRYGAAAAVRGGTIYVAGGVGAAQQRLASTEQLPVTVVCNSVARRLIPDALGHAEVLGPPRRGGTLADIASTQVSHPSCWGRAPALVNGRSFAAMVVRDSILYLVGGLEDSLDPDVWTAERLEPGANAWVPELLPLPRSGVRVGAAWALTQSGALVMAGGGHIAEKHGARRRSNKDQQGLRHEFLPLGHVEGLQALFCGGATDDMEYPGLVWSPLPSLQVPRFNAGIATAGGNIYLMGGCGQGGEALKSFERLELGAQSWEGLPCMHTARSGAAVAAARF